MRRIGEHTTEFFFFLGPFALTFVAIGLPGIRIAGVFLYPYQALLLILLPISALLTHPRWSQILSQTPAVRFLFLALLVIVLLALTLKRLPTPELREIKNIILPLALMFFCASRYLTTTDRAKRLMLAMGGGILASMLLVYILFGMAALEVRGIDATDLGAGLGLTYVWLGVGGSGIFAAGLALAGRTAAPFSATLAGSVFLALGSTAILLSGTRAVLLGTLLFPFLLIANKRLPLKLQRLFAITVLVTAFFLSNFPAAALSVFPYRYYRTTETAQGANRLVDVDSYGTTLGSRFTHWSWMLANPAPSSYVIGFDYGEAVARSPTLGHPHNVFLWGRLLGGLLPSFLLLLWLGSLILAALRSSFFAPPQLQSLARSNLYLQTVLLLVLLSNSLAGGTHLLVGIALALSAFLSSAIPPNTPVPNSGST